jgi:hypothetical protein
MDGNAVDTTKGQGRVGQSRGIDLIRIEHGGESVTRIL